MSKRKAIGERGSWFATVDGERLPCVHRYWVTGKLHSDPGYLEGEGKWPEFVDAIREKMKVILTKDEPIGAPDKKSGVVFKRTGYIAVFSVADVCTNEHGLHFKLLERLYDLA